MRRELPRIDNQEEAARDVNARLTGWFKSNGAKLHALMGT